MDVRDRIVFGRKLKLLKHKGIGGTYLKLAKRDPVAFILPVRYLRNAPTRTGVVKFYPGVLRCGALEGGIRGVALWTKGDHGC